MIYGIDLGTTNSLIGFRNTLLSGLVPSIVDLKNRRAGESERLNWETERGFKVNMSSGASGIVPVEASSLVLKELKRVAGLTDTIDTVISVPAYFNNSQRQATMQAAKKAGMNVRALINEPTAAAMYISRNTNGTSVIFDLGGGTFDISVIESVNGTYKVLATDGRILGGNDLDKTILQVLGNRCGLNWKIFDNQYLALATDLKHRMQREGKTVTLHLNDVDVTFTLEDYINCVKHTFMPAIVMAKSVISETAVTDFSFYFVGGSTRCPYLREWVLSELNIQPQEHIAYDPDKVVAQGACYFAELLEKGQAKEVLADVSKLIGFSVAGKLLNVLVPRNTHLPFSCMYTYVASYTVPVKTFSLNFYQGDSLLVDECQNIGKMTFSFKEEKEPGMSVFDLDIKVDINGVITIKCSEILEEPQEVRLEVI